MKHDVLSLRQLMVILVTALLARLSEMMPVIAAETARGAGWLVPLLAVPVLLAAFWAAGRIVRGGGICGILGKPVGCLINIMYMGWTLVVLATVFRSCGARLAQIYGAMPAFVCTALLLVLVIWVAMGKMAAFARAVEIFYLVLAVVTAGVLILAFFRVETNHFRIAASDLERLPIGAVTAAGLILNVYPAVVLGQRVAPHTKNGKRAIGWIVSIGAAGALLVAAVVGCLGTGLTLQLPNAFFIMVQGLGIKGAFQRTEAFVTALWTLSDLALAGTLLHAWRGMGNEIHPGEWSKYSVPVAAIAALIGGWMAFKTLEDFRYAWVKILPMAGIVFGLIFPLLTGFLSCVRKKTK